MRAATRDPRGAPPPRRIAAESSSSSAAVRTSRPACAASSASTCLGWRSRPRGDGRGRRRRRRWWRESRRGAARTRGAAPASGVGEAAPDVSARHQHERCDDPRRDGEPHDVEAVAVEQRDDEDAADVVEDRERRHEHDEGVRHARSQRASGRRHRTRCRSPSGFPSPCRPGPFQLNARKSAAGKSIPPSAATAGSTACGSGAQLADRELTLDLQADDEEEDRHQPVVDEPRRRVNRARSGPAASSTGGPRIARYTSDAPEFARTSAATAQLSRTMPLAASRRRNTWIGRTTAANNGRVVFAPSGERAHVPLLSPCPLHGSRRATARLRIEE